MKQGLLKSVGIYTAWIVSLFFFLFPLFWVLSVSLKPALLAFKYPPVWLFRPTFEHYLGLESAYLASLKNSAIVTAGTITLSMLIGVPAAYGLTRGRLRISTPLFSWTFFVRMAPGMIFVIPFFVIYRHIGLTDTYLGLIILYMIFNLPLVLGSMVAYFSSLSVEMEEAALVDGATKHQVFFHIVLPLTTPGLTATAILCFLFSWNQFFFALIFSRTSTRTAPVAIMNFIRYEGIDWGSLSAGVILLIIPVIVFAVLIRRYLVQGLTAGALKE